MADNTTLPGAGDVIALDELTDATLGLCKVQFMKLMDGTLNSTNKLIINSTGESLALSRIGDGTNVATVKAASTAAVAADKALVVAISPNNIVNIDDLDTVATGSLTATGSVTTASLNGVDGASVQVTGTWAGTLTFEGSVDGTNFFVIPGTSFNSNGILGTTATANGQWQFDISGVQLFRVRCSAFTSGTIIITIRATSGCSMVSIDAPLPPGTNLIGIVGIDQTTPGSTNGVSLAFVGNTAIVTGGVAGSQGVGGLAASGATKAGNPVQVGGVFNATQPTVTTGQAVEAQYTARGAKIVTLSGVDNTIANAGFVKLTDGTNTAAVLATILAVKTDNSSIAGTVIPSAGLAGAMPVGGCAASGSSIAGNPILLGGTFTTTQPTITTGQAVNLQTTNRGALLVSLASVENTATNAGFVKLSDGTTAVSVISATNALKADLSSVAGTATVTGGVNGSLGVGGVTAVNATSTGNPVFTGGIASVGANPTKATNGQRTGVLTDAIGRVIIVQNHGRTMAGAATPLTLATTTETTLLTSAASTFYDLTGISFTNSGASATIVTLRDGSAGTIKGVWSITAGGGIVHPFNPPLEQATVATNWTIQLGTATTSVQANAYYVKNT